MGSEGRKVGGYRGIKGGQEEGRTQKAQEWGQVTPLWGGRSSAPGLGGGVFSIFQLQLEAGPLLKASR